MLIYTVVMHAQALAPDRVLDRISHNETTHKTSTSRVAVLGI
jgi:hypothetical protein